MRIVFKFILAVAIAISVGSVSFADVLDGFLTFDGPQHNPGGAPFQGGGEDKLQDDSLARFFDLDRSGGISVGDQVVSLVTLSEVKASGQSSRGVGANSQIAIVSSYEVAGNGSAGSWRLAPIVSGPNSLGTLLDSSVSAPAGLDANSLAVVLTTTTSDSNATADPLNWTFSQISDGTTGFGTANNWQWEMTLGLIPGTADFLEFMGSLGLGGTQRGAFTVQSSIFGATFLPVDVFDFGAATHLGDATLDFATIGIASRNEQARGWTFRDQASFFINPIPEPGLGLLLGLLGSVAMLGRRRS